MVKHKLPGDMAAKEVFREVCEVADSASSGMSSPAKELIPLVRKLTR